MYARVVVDIPTSEVDELYTYKIPKELEDCIYVGSRVFVEFGFQKTLGFVMEIINEADFTGNLKDILEVVDFENGLNDDQLVLSKKLAYSLMVPLTNTLNLMYPCFMKSRIRKSLNVLNYDALDAEVALLLENKNNVLINNKILSKYSKIKKEILKGNIELKTNIYTYGKSKLVRFYKATNILFPPSTKLRSAVLEFVRGYGEATLEEIKENTGASEYVVNKLLESGNLTYEERLPKLEYYKKDITYKINKTIDFDILKNKYRRINNKPYLLYTNDNSFRDDFLLDVACDAIEEGKKVLVVCPTVLENIRITNFFEKGLDKRILSFSSKLTNSEYYYNYNKLINNDVDLVITTKSGVFLPLENIGLIVVIDSEDKNYLNEQNPKYSTVEVLKERAEYHQAKIIYTSSAPSIVDYYNYYTNKYTILSKMVPNSKDLILVNMREEYLNNLLSSRLSLEIEKNLEKKKIVVLVLNSLSYNQTILCSECMSLITCPDCLVGVTYHKNKGVYQCPSCSKTIKPSCKCGVTKFKHFGYGLELLKEVLHEKYKEAKILQVDSETLSSESEYQDFFLALEEKEVDIVIGTNQIASLNHEDIGLVGYINIDNLLKKCDYRSSEETYSLVSKLSAKMEATVVIQGYNLDHYAITSALSGNYDSFFEKELENRKTYNYPPFIEISRLLVVGEYNDIYYFSNYFKKIFSRMSTTQILGPVYISKIKGIQLIIKYNDYDKLYKLIEEVKKKFSDKKIFVNFERYPLSFN